MLGKKGHFFEHHGYDVTRAGNAYEVAPQKATFDQSGIYLYQTGVCTLDKAQERTTKAH